MKSTFPLPIVRSWENLYQSAYFNLLKAKERGDHLMALIWLDQIDAIDKAMKHKMDLLAKASPQAR